MKKSAAVCALFVSMVWIPARPAFAEDASWAVCAGEIRREDADKPFLGGTLTVQDPAVASAVLLRVPTRIDGALAELPEIELRGLKSGKTTIELSAGDAKKTLTVNVSDCGADTVPEKAPQILEVCEGRIRRTKLQPGIRNFSVLSQDPGVVDAGFRGKGRVITLEGKKTGETLVVLKAYCRTRSADGELTLEPRVRKYLVRVVPCGEGRAEGDFYLFSKTEASH
ncbi:MAG TPA: hypothetical protein VL404_07150 [Candidatus Eisenbacteria bacterium]|nr:hypothetical protein [Candidatus Eisenbacteria bacterium]